MGPTRGVVESAGYRLNGRLDARLVDLLEIWGRSARALGEEEIATAARLQSELLENWKNWDKAIAAFRRVPQGSLHSGNTSSPNGGNSSPKEALLERARMRPKSPTGFKPWLMPPGKDIAVGIPSAPGSGNGSTPLNVIPGPSAVPKVL